MPKLRRAAPRHGWNVIVCTGLLFLPMLGASAAALQVSPIRVDLAADQPATVLTLRNEGKVPLDAQVRVFAWTQSLDEDRLESTAAIVASPPIVRIAPNADQTVRVLRVTSAPLAHEETYRLLIDEIPDGQTQRDGVHMQLRYSVPVFAGATEAHADALTFALERVDAVGSAPTLMLRASNGSDGHAQLSRVQLDWSNGDSTLISDGLLGYALPRAVRRWPVTDVPSGITTATLHAFVNGVPVTMLLSVVPAHAMTTASPGH
ncbi:molecular chaperone [Caballeronia sp. AZ10_KS36]|uniref:fimbrial biogenesis chaperone n=1 Tax=Caballeronia sp. AZ10_KS36 TaxID=2921757 RepID=UPI002028E4C2|nr:molecular chaperone [Caballeronia sp. AZ10_KS36]